jgi:hypothetical protein
VRLMLHPEFEKIHFGNTGHQGPNKKIEFNRNRFKLAHVARPFDSNNFLILYSKTPDQMYIYGSPVLLNYVEKELKRLIGIMVDDVENLEIPETIPMP